MLTAGWQGRLEGAAREEDVLSVCRDFVAARTSQELDELPATCLPGPLASAEDVQRYALSLIHQLAIDDRISAPAMNRLSVFFTRAALRLMQLATKTTDYRRQA